MALTTLFGTTQLALQDALAKQLDARDQAPRVPNFAVISLRRDRFLKEHTGALETERERFRSDLHEATTAFLLSNSWRVGGTGTLVINLLLRAIRTDCSVQLRCVDALYELLIRDDGGERRVAVKSTVATVGRKHDAHSRGFIPVQDQSRLISREHLRLRYQDLDLSVALLGRNPTTLNSEPLGESEQVVKEGDTLRCGGIEVVVARKE